MTTKAYRRPALLAGAGTTAAPAVTVQRVRRKAMWAMAAAMAMVAAGCGDGSTHTTSAPVLTVVTGLWPLAQAAAEIGQANVRVDDVVPPGSDPQTYQLSAKTAAVVRKAGVILEIGGGFQPSFEAAAAGAHPVQLRPSPAASPYVWLNPFTMEQTARTIAAALEKADPGAKATYQTGLDNQEANLGSLDADYQSTLSTCPDQTLVTIDDAFAGLHGRYPVVDKAIVTGSLTPIPSAVEIQAEVAVIRSTGATKVYNETWIPESDILAATAETKVKVGTLDTLEGPPSPTPWPYTAGKKYVSLMETNLTAISSALHCPNPDDT